MDGISNVQIIVLGGILAVSDTDYRTLAAEALEVHPDDVPDMADLSYKQATAVIYCGNEMLKSITMRTAVDPDALFSAQAQGRCAWTGYTC